MDTPAQRGVTGRFAPSPTGRMHLGNVFSALISYLSVKSRGGEWLLRIEDIDRGRCREEYISQIKDDLCFLGLVWDRGGDGMYRQSNRDAIYKEYLEHLTAKGLTYPCWCTRAELLASSAPHESDGRIVYPGTCRHNPERSRLNEGRPAATRIIVPDRDITFTDRHFGLQTANLAKDCGDFILRRSDGAWAYQLAVVVDDALMGVTEVVRGCDLLLSAAQQIYLFEELGFNEPEYAHFPLLCNAEGERLCKRDKGLDMGELRKTMTAEQIIGKLAFHAGLIPSEETCSVADLIPLFKWESIPYTKKVTAKLSTSLRGV